MRWPSAARALRVALWTSVAAAVARTAASSLVHLTHALEDCDRPYMRWLVPLLVTDLVGAILHLSVLRKLNTLMAAVGDWQSRTFLSRFHLLLRGHLALLSCCLSVLQLGLYVPDVAWLLNESDCVSAPLVVTWICLLMLHWFSILLGVLLLVAVVSLCPRRLHPQSRAAVMPMPSSPASPGASVSSIAKLRIVKAGSRLAEESCAVCLDSYVVGEYLLQLKCRHTYHIKCGETWLTINASCPLCNRRVEDVGSPQLSGIQVSSRWSTPTGGRSPSAAGSVWSSNASLPRLAVPRSGAQTPQILFSPSTPQSQRGMAFSAVSPQLLDSALSRVFSLPPARLADYPSDGSRSGGTSPSDADDSVPCSSLLLERRLGAQALARSQSRREEETLEAALRTMRAASVSSSSVVSPPPPQDTLESSASSTSPRPQNASESSASVASLPRPQDAVGVDLVDLAQAEGLLASVAP